MNVYAFADEASASIDKQIEAMKRFTANSAAEMICKQIFLQNK